MQGNHSTDLLGLFFEDTDKFLTDDLTLRFRLCNTCKFVIISLLCIHADKVQVKLTIRSEYTFNLITFIFTKKAMIYKYAGKLLADRSGKEVLLPRRNLHHLTGQGELFHHRLSRGSL